MIFGESAADIRIDPSHSRQLIAREHDAAEQLFRLEETLSFWAASGYVNGNWEDAFRALNLQPRWRLSTPGCFFADTTEQYEAEINILIEELIAPSRAPTMI